MSAELWDNAILIIYFLYGLAFYSMGLALFIESGRASELRFARSMRLLAGFGLLHGAHEWIDLFEQAAERLPEITFPDTLYWMRLALLAMSFIWLLAFGEHLLAWRNPAQWGTTSFRLTMAAAGWFTVSCIVVKAYYDLDDPAWGEAIDGLSRYVIGLPSALLACVALWRQRPGFQKRGMGRFAQDLTLAAVAFALYGLLGQIFIAKNVLLPSRVINAAFFEDMFGFPVQLLRAVLAGLIAYSMIRVLRALEFENQQRLGNIEAAKLEAERRSHEELTRLNRQLQASNEATSRLLAEVRSRDALRGQLLQQITAAQEAERKRVARELHDGTGQALTGLALGLQGLTNQNHGQNADLRGYLSTLQEMATNALTELRVLINDLRPPQLDDMGLVAALRWMTRRFNERGGAKVDLQICGEPYPLASDVETMLFRIAQESLTNIAKHANAQHATIRLDYDDGPALVVRDDGVGFDVSSVEDQNSLHRAWGLIGIRERTMLIGASLTLESAPGQGTTVTVRITESQPAAVEQEGEP